jgi:hypothetical protein
LKIDLNFAIKRGLVGPLEKFFRLKRDGKENEGSKEGWQKKIKPPNAPGDEPGAFLFCEFPVKIFI